MCGIIDAWCVQERGVMPAIPARSSSAMTVRIFTPTQGALDSWVPFSGITNFLGEGVVEFPYFENIGDFKAAVSNVPLDNFLYQVFITVDIQKAGLYTFYIYSGNGALLYVDDSLVVDNDGQHNPQTASGTMTLNSGRHKV
jgi:hypothetical protein